MKKFIGLLIIIGLIVGGFYYKENLQTFVADVMSSFSNEKLLREKPKLLREFPPKEVEIFHVGKEKIALNVTKTGETSSSTSVSIMPQISGKIIDIQTELGSYVQKGDTLFRLGDSLSTEIANLQYSAAIDGLNLTKSSKELTADSGMESMQSAELGLLTAKTAYENAVKSKKDSKKILEDQIESTEFSIETAEDTYEDLEDSIDEAADTRDDLEDKYDDLSDSLENAQDEAKKLEISAGLKELSQAITQIETQIDTLKSAKEAAQSGLDQADLGLQQVKDSATAQLNQLDAGIETIFLQYKLAQNQLDSLKIGTDLQDLAVDGQILQASSALEALELSIKNQTITSPIDGVITSLQAEEENLVAPGQILAKIENLSQLSVKTSVNLSEAQLINMGDEVTIENDSISSQGTIISISPTLNEMSKKIDIEIELDQTTGITSGEFVKIVFSLNPNKKIFIPLNSVYINEGEKFIKFINNNLIVYSQKITTGQIIGDYIEVTSGLNGNEKIIKDLSTFVKEGEKVALK